MRNWGIESAAVEPVELVDVEIVPHVVIVVVVAAAVVVGMEGTGDIVYVAVHNGFAVKEELEPSLELRVAANRPALDKD